MRGGPVGRQRFLRHIFDLGRSRMSATAAVPAALVFLHKRRESLLVAALRPFYWLPVDFAVDIGPPSDRRRTAKAPPLVQSVLQRLCATDTRTLK
jgi:hypothetical protein